jgi:hypothetical protein
MVIQRYRKARIVLNDTKVVTLGEEAPLLTADDKYTDDADDDATTTKTTKTLGVVVYVSFSSKIATFADIEHAAKTILQLPIHTFGRWGDGLCSGIDGGQTQSLLQILSSRHEQMTNHSRSASRPDNIESNTSSSLSPISLLIVPQANLISKIKKNGKSVQYHDQIHKDLGQEMYDAFIDKLHQLLLDHQSTCRNHQTVDGNKSGEKTSQTTAATTPDSSISPKELFRQGQYEGLYDTYDPTTGIPLTMITKGRVQNSDDATEAAATANTTTTISKSARKKLQKIYDAHVKRHEKWLQKQQQQQKPEENNSEKDGGSTYEVKEQTPLPLTTGTGKDDLSTEVSPSSSSLDPAFVQFVAGSFGKRQGLEMFSDMGPFCHIVDV